VSVVNESSAILVRYRGVSGYYVCADQWTSAFSDAVCRQLGYELVFFFIYAQSHADVISFIVDLQKSTWFY